MKDGLVLQHASEEVRGDREVVTEAVRKAGGALKFASEEMKGDRSVVAEAVRQFNYNIKTCFLNSNSNNTTKHKTQKTSIVAEAVRQDCNALQWAAEELRGDRKKNN